MHSAVVGAHSARTVFTKTGFWMPLALFVASPQYGSDTASIAVQPLSVTLAASLSTDDCLFFSAESRHSLRPPGPLLRDHDSQPNPICCFCFCFCCCCSVNPN